MLLNPYVDGCLRKPGGIPMSPHVVISSLLLGKASQQGDTGERARQRRQPAMFERCSGRRANKRQGTARGNVSPLAEK